MKNLLIIALIITAFAASAQNVVITKKDGQILETKIIGNSATTLYYSGGSIAIADVQSADIKDVSKMADELSALLAKNNIPVTVQGTTTETIKQTILTTQPQEVTVDQLAQSMENFRVARTAAKGLQAVGIVLVAASLIVKDSGNVLPAVGAGVSLIGFGMDIGAGAKLKIKR